MTPRQQQALDFVRERILRAGFSPSGPEIAAHLGVPVSTSYYVVDSLVAQGLLARRPGAARGLKLPNVPDLRTVDSELLKAELARRGEATGAFARPERRAFGRGRVTCSADACDVIVPKGHAFCRRHWHNLPRETQCELIATHQAALDSGHAEDARRYQDVFGRARDEATSRGGSW